MEQLTQILQDATAAIGAEYFLLPIHGGDPVYRLNGEVDKMGHPYFEDAAAPKPDLLVHQPGHGNNYAIVEVKSCHAAVDGIRKDLNTLSRFGNEFGYQRAIYLVYGAAPDGVLALVQKCAVGLPHHAPIELWLHTASGAPAAPIGNIA